MVSFWAEGEITGDVINIHRLGPVDLSSIPGNGWPAPKLRKAEDFLHGLMETRTLAADVHPQEQCLGWTPEQMQAEFGNRMWWDGDDLVARSTSISLSWDGNTLSASFSEVK